MKQFAIASLAVARAVRNILIGLSVIPLCIYSTYLQLLTNPNPAHWAWLDAQEHNILVLSFVSTILLLWFCIEKAVRQNQWWWLSVTWLSVTLYTCALCGVLRLMGDTFDGVAKMPLLFLLVSTLINPLIIVTYIQIADERNKKAAKSAEPAEPAEQEQIITTQTMEQE